MKLILISTQNDYATCMDKVPNLAKFLTEEETLENTDLLLVNVVCKQTIEEGKHQGNIMILHCMNIINIVSKFRSFKNDLIETKDEESLKLRTALELGKHCGQRDEQKVVLITNDGHLMETFGELSSEHGIHCLTSKDLA